MESTLNIKPTAPAMAVSIREAAELLRVNHKTIRREIGRGTLKALRIGRVYRIRMEEIQAYLRRLEGA